MKALIQRVKRASVTIEGELFSAINSGILVFLGVEKGDEKENAEKLAQKIVNLRIFEDENDVMNRSLLDINGNILSISQFTLYGDASKGRRPSYIKALGGDKATLLYDEFNNKLRDKGIEVGTGIFGADMKVSLINDGPVTILLEK